ncbi:MAG: TlpA family protein disulfide reductase [Betaproteobacteria bacterium]
MRKTISALLWIILLFSAGATAYAAETKREESKCPPGAGQAKDSSGICADPGQGLLQPLLQIGEKEPPSETAGAEGPRQLDSRAGTIIVYLFWGTGCPHCEDEKRYLAELQRKYPDVEVKECEVFYNKQNRSLLTGLLKVHGMQASGVPITFVDDKVFVGFSQQTKEAMEKAIRACRVKSCVDPADFLKDRGRLIKPERAAQAISGVTVTTPGKEKGLSVDIPLFGTRDAGNTSLPLLTLVIAGMDSFNPCAFFVLLSLLGLLVHAQSRNKMLLVGGVFVFFSGVIYFLFMAAWLNLFLVMGNVSAITKIAGGVSLLIAAVNIKDFFIFRKGVSLTIPDSAKPKLFDRMRKLLRSTSLFSIIAGTAVLAIVANSYEILCTAGFPMVFTRILTLYNLTTTSYYLYLALYNIVYIVPLFIIVLAFTITLGSRKLSERQGRTLKLVSGTMMLGLGGVLLVNPTLLNSLMMSFVLLAGSIAASFIVISVAGKYETKSLGENRTRMQ